MTTLTNRHPEPAQRALPVPVRREIGCGKLDAGLIRAVTFALLLDVAGPLVKSYRSDFFHDAQWIADNVDNLGDTEFFYGADETGTHINLSRELTVKYRANAWLIEVTCDGRYGDPTDGTWTVKATPVD